MERQGEEYAINLLDLFYYLKKRVLVIVAAVLVCAVAGFFVTQLFMDPQYTASTRMYVLNRSNESNVVSSDFQVSTYVLNDYKVLITGQNVTKEVIKRLDLDMKPAELAERIVVTAPDNTRVLQISITDTDPEVAADIANTVRAVAAQQIQTIMDVDAVKLVYEADVPQSPSGPNVRRNTVIAAALGLVAAVGVFAVMFVLDDTIRTEEDVERYLGLSTMGVIPMSEELITGAAKTNNRSSVGRELLKNFKR